jgi:hypothetical protein
MIKTFVLNYYNFSPKTFYHFQNEKNLYSIANIFNMILNNLNSSMIEEKIQIIIYILLIGERSYYNNIYLCYLLWENNFLKLKEVWEKLINRRFIQRLSFRVKKIIESRNNEEMSIFSSFKKLMSEESLRRSYFEGANYNLLREESFDTRIKRLGYEILNRATPEVRQILLDRMTLEGLIVHLPASPHFIDYVYNLYNENPNISI